MKGKERIEEGALGFRNLTPLTKHSSVKLLLHASILYVCSTYTAEPVIYELTTYHISS